MKVKDEVATQISGILATQKITKVPQTRERERKIEATKEKIATIAMTATIATKPTRTNPEEPKKPKEPQKRTEKDKLLPIGEIPTKDIPRKPKVFTTVRDREGRKIVTRTLEEKRKEIKKTRNRPKNKEEKIRKTFGKTIL